MSVAGGKGQAGMAWVSGCLMTGVLAQWAVAPSHMIKPLLTGLQVEHTESSEGLAKRSSAVLRGAGAEQSVHGTGAPQEGPPPTDDTAAAMVVVLLLLPPLSDSTYWSVYCGAREAHVRGRSWTQGKRQLIVVSERPPTGAHTCKITNTQAQVHRDQ